MSSWRLGMASTRGAGVLTGGGGLLTAPIGQLAHQLGQQDQASEAHKGDAHAHQAYEQMRYFWHSELTSQMNLMLSYWSNKKRARGFASLFIGYSHSL